MASIGAIKIPLQSTFDPAGVNAAEAAMKKLASNAQGGVGGGGGGGTGGGGGGGKSIPGMADFKSLASQAGLGGPVDMISKFMSPSMGIASGAVAAFAMTQKFAVQAREIRMESARLGTTTGFYRDLSINARQAGVDLGTVTAGMEKVQSRAHAALTGDVGAMAYFSAMGLSHEQLAGMAGDSGQLAQTVARRGSSSQKISGFGTIAAADVAGAQGGGMLSYGRAQNDALERTGLNLEKLPGNIMAGANSIMSAIAFRTQAQGRAWGGGISFGEAEQQMEKEAKSKENVEKIALRKSFFEEAGQKTMPGLMSPRELAAAKEKSEANYLYGDDATNTKFHARAKTQRIGEQFAAESKYMNPWEQRDKEEEINRRQVAEGTLTGTQGYRANIASKEKIDATLASVESNANNIVKQMRTGEMKFGDPDATDKTRKVAARTMGMQLEEYAGSMTRSGGLASGADANSVAGYSQQVNAEYAMSQSLEQRALMGAIMNMMNLPANIVDAINSNLGFQNRAWGPGL